MLNPKCKHTLLRKCRVGAALPHLFGKWQYMFWLDKIFEQKNHSWLEFEKQSPNKLGIQMKCIMNIDENKKNLSYYSLYYEFSLL